MDEEVEVDLAESVKKKKKEEKEEKKKHRHQDSGRFTFEQFHTGTKNSNTATFFSSVHKIAVLSAK